MAVSKRWHIALSTTESSRPFNMSIPKKTGFFFCAVVIAFVLIFIGSIAYVVYNHNKIAEAQNIIKENELLKERLFTLSFEIDSIMTKLKLMENWEDKIRSDKNFKSINKEIREMGVGGLPQVDSTFTYSDKLFYRVSNHRAKVPG